MNKNILYIFMALMIVFVSCNDDEEPFVEFKKSKYDLSEGEEGSVQREIYNFYTKYNSIILVNADSSDYRYNFASPNAIKIVNADEAYHKAGIQFLYDVWLNNYSDEFNQKFLPFSIILCDTIYDAKGNELEMYSSRGFVALSGVNEDLESMSDETKKAFSKKLNFEFLGKNMLAERKAFVIPNKFFSISKRYYGEMSFLDDEEIYKQGFLDTDFVRPSRDQDGVQYIKFITLSTQEHIDYMTSTYPNIKLKYDILKQFFADEFAIDILNFTK